MKKTKISDIVEHITTMWLSRGKYRFPCSPTHPNKIWRKEMSRREWQTFKRLKWDFLSPNSPFKLIHPESHREEEKMSLRARRIDSQTFVGKSNEVRQLIHSSTWGIDQRKGSGKIRQGLLPLPCFILLHMFSPQCQSIKPPDQFVFLICPINFPFSLPCTSASLLVCGGLILMWSDL